MSELHLLVQCGAILLNVMSTISVLRFITGSRDCGHDLLPCLQRHWGLKEPKMSRQGAQSGKQAVGGAWQIQLVGVQRWSSTRQDRGQIWILFEETLLKCKDEDHQMTIMYISLPLIPYLGETNAPPSLANKYAKQTFHEMWDIIRRTRIRSWHTLTKANACSLWCSSPRTWCALPATQSLHCAFGYGPFAEFPQVLYLIFAWLSGIGAAHSFCSSSPDTWSWKVKRCHKIVCRPCQVRLMSPLVFDMLSIPLSARYRRSEFSVLAAGY